MWSTNAQIRFMNSRSATPAEFAAIGQHWTKVFRQAISRFGLSDVQETDVS
jgi:hypothetical protein